MSSSRGEIIGSDVKGIVSWFNFVKRYGFIMSDYGDVFVHKSDLINRQCLRTGQMVTFSIIDAPRGPQAINVEVISIDNYLENDAVDDFSGDVSDASDYAEDLLAIALLSLAYNDDIESSDNEQGATSSNDTDTKDEGSSGFDTARFESTVPDELICSICKGVLNDPVQTVCEHLFCRSCIEKWLKRQQVCPMDREPLCQKDVYLAPRYLKRMLGALKLHCSFAHRGCNTVVTIDGLENHLKECEHGESGTSKPNGPERYSSLRDALRTRKFRRRRSNLNSSGSNSYGNGDVSP